LQKIGVIKVETRTKAEEFSGDVKSYLYLVYATNQIEA
jgi:hypothetical protein